jgi:hypothetical protein
MLAGCELFWKLSLKKKLAKMLALLQAQSGAGLLHQEAV